MDFPISVEFTDRTDNFLEDIGKLILHNMVLFIQGFNEALLSLSLHVQDMGEGKQHISYITLPE